VDDARDELAHALLLARIVERFDGARHRRVDGPIDDGPHAALLLRVLERIEGALDRSPRDDPGGLLFGRLLLDRLHGAPGRLLADVVGAGRPGERERQKRCGPDSAPPRRHRPIQDGHAPRARQSRHARNAAWPDSYLALIEMFTLCGTPSPRSARSS